MARTSDQNKSIKTIIFRRKIWSRRVRWELFPERESNLALSDYIGTEILVRLKIENENLQAEKGYTHQVFNRSIANEALSKSVWHNWWTGSVHISDYYIALLEFLIPKSSEILKSKLPADSSQSFNTFLYALDIDIQSKNKDDKAIEIIHFIAKKWRPQTQIYKDYELGKALRYHLNIFNLQVPIVVGGSYEKLSPLTIIDFLIKLASYYCIHEKRIKEWTFDLLAACIACHKLLDREDFFIINENNRTVNLMYFVLNIFIWSNGRFINTVKAFAGRPEKNVYATNKKLILKSIISLETLSTSQFIETEQIINEINCLADNINAGLDLYFNSFRDFGINLDDINEIMDPEEVIERYSDSIQLLNN